MKRLGFLPLRPPLRMAAALLALPLMAAPLFAGLGGDVASVKRDQQQLRGELQTTQSASFTMQEIKTSDGAHVREYVSPSGTVFAVAFDGPTLSDLRPLLGSYFDQFAQARNQQQRHARHAPLVIEQGDLVVQIGGRMRAFHGMAYISSQIPSGVHKEDIR